MSLPLISDSLFSSLFTQVHYPPLPHLSHSLSLSPPSTPPSHHTPISLSHAHTYTCRVEHTTTHSETGRLPGSDELNVTRHSILTHPALHPHLPQFIAGLINGHPGFKVVHTAEHHINRLALLQVTFAGERETEQWRIKPRQW